MRTLGFAALGAFLGGLSAHFHWGRGLTCAVVAVIVIPLLSLDSYLAIRAAREKEGR